MVTVLDNTGTLVKTGYTFAGWNTAANGSGDGYAAAATFAMGSSNVTLYAQWTENAYSVTYNGNSSTGGSVPTDASSYHNGDAATVLGNTGTLVRTGYAFADWNTAANGSGTGYSPGDPLSIGLGNVTLYAQWTPIDYAVTYNGNTNTGGAVPTDGTAYHITDMVTVPGNTGTLVKTGYNFAGWNTAANGSGTGYAAAATFAMGSSNVTLYAQWTENTYSVTYNGNSNTGGLVPTDGSTYYITDTATVLGNTGALVRTGYTFAGWNTAANGSGTSYAGGDTFAIGAGNVTLYARWTPVEYTVTYNGNTNTGGSVPTDGGVYHITDTVTVLGNTGTLTKTGYAFAGWNTASNGSGTSYSGGGTFAMGAGNVTIYAQWTESTYDITYDANTGTGGSVPVDGTAYHNGDTVTVAGNTGTLAKTGYTFAGWNTAANGSGTSYSGGGTFAMGAGNVTLYASWTAVNYTVTYDGNGSSGGSVPIDGNTYHITDTVTVLGNTGNLARTGYAFGGWNTTPGGSGTNYAAASTLAMGDANITLYARWTLRSGETSNPENGGAQVFVNDVLQNAGTAVTATVDGVSVTTVAIDEAKVEQKLAAEGNGAVVSVLVENGSDAVVGQFNGQMAKNMENREAVMEIRTADATYTLPAVQIDIDSVSNQFGEDVALRDITVSVEVAKASTQTVRFVENMARRDTFTLMVSPLEFSVRCTYGDQTVDVTYFSAYVDRTVAIPEGINPAKITTGVVIGTDGTIHHVPTRIMIIDGKYYAQINSLTNSAYALINNQISFSDVEAHWSKNAVNDLASRMIIKGISANMFEPDSEITRAEFVDILIESLGPMRSGQGTEVFSDVMKGKNYHDVVSTAFLHGMITGYGNGKFGPDDMLTREQAMAMIGRSMKFTNPLAALTDTEERKILGSFADIGSVSAYAKQGIAYCVKMGIVLGKDEMILAPKDYITRAEVAAMIQRMLKKSNLIN
jgi:uncharacterized repeat protein (TIGR02543 family)